MRSSPRLASGAVVTADTTREQAIEAAAKALYEHAPQYLVDEARGMITGPKPWEWMGAEYQGWERERARIVIEAAGLVLSPKDEPTARLDGGKPHERIITGLEAIMGSSDLENWPEARDIIHDAISELSFEPSQPKLDPRPWVSPDGQRWMTHILTDEEFKPRPEFSQVESQYPHRKA